MFTGLVEEVGVVRRSERRGEGGLLVVSAQKVLEGTRLGDSISVSGACLTVTAVGPDEFTADCMPETLSRTTIGVLRPGAEVNLERSLAMGDRLGGHLVLGHVDAVSVVESLDRRGDSLEVRLSLVEGVAPFLAEKGSIAVDGVSLTVIRVEPGAFVVGLIPHTIGETTLRSLKKGTVVNLEADVIARYVRRSLEATVAVGTVRTVAAGGLTEEFLREKGFA